jgi:hypothetical protein
MLTPPGQTQFPSGGPSPLSPAVGKQPPPPIWDEDEPYRRFARHYLDVAASGNQLCQSHSGTRVQEGQAVFAEEWPHLKEAWEWAKLKMTAEEGAARLCIGYLKYTRNILTKGIPQEGLVALIEAALEAATMMRDGASETLALSVLAARV